MSNINDFTIVNGVLEKYIGAGGEVIIPDSVTEIGWRAFKGCAGIKSITIPEGVKKIVSGAFRYCTGLTNITVAENNKTYYSENNCIIERENKMLVQGCKNSIIPENVTEIGWSAFEGCKGLKSITFSDCVTVIYPEAFKGCTRLKSITIPDSVTEISKGAFWNCTGLTCVIIPGSVKVIGEYAFSNCTSLTSVNIPDSVKVIGERAFSNCTDLKNITIPDSAKKIGSGAFADCDNATISFFGNCIYDHHWFINSSSEKPKCRLYCPNIHISNIPSQLKLSAVTGFAEKSAAAVKEDIMKGYTDYLKKQRKKYYPLFRDYPVLLSFFTENKLIPVNEISQLIESASDVETKAVLLEYSNSFSEEEKTKAQKKQEKQQQNEFEKPIRSKELTISDYKKIFLLQTNGNEIEVIGYKSKEPDVIIPEFMGKKKVTKIGRKAFWGCASRLKSIIIPNSITEIGSNAFEGCNGLTSITIPDSVTEIGWCSFQGCTGLTSIIIADSLKKISKGAFLRCTGLINIIIPDSVTEIGLRAFSGCTGLTSVTIPDSVTEIGLMAFSGCTGIKDVYYTGTEEQWQKIIIGQENEPIEKAAVHFNSER